MSALPISVNIRWRWSAPSIGISASISATPRNGGCGTGSTPTRSTSMNRATSTARRQFGLSEQAIHERFADYMTRHDLFER